MTGFSQILFRVYFFRQNGLPGLFHHCDGCGAETAQLRKVSHARGRGGRLSSGPEEFFVFGRFSGAFYSCEEVIQKATSADLLQIVRIQLQVHFLLFDLFSHESIFLKVSLTSSFRIPNNPPPATISRSSGDSSSGCSMIFPLSSFHVRFSFSMPFPYENEHNVSMCSFSFPVFVLPMPFPSYGFPTSVVFRRTGEDQRI